MSDTASEVMVSDTASEIMVSDTGVPSLIVIGAAIYQLETKVSLKTICCLRLFVVVYKHVMF